MALNLHARGAANWQASDDLIEFIGAYVRPGMRTLETGAGLSTLAFVAAGATHTAITPSADEIDAIGRELERRGLDSKRVDIVQAFSHKVLPGMTGMLDVALIDGGHGFPIPQVDWTYIAPRLNVGGLLIIDDIDLWTGRILVDFLRHEPGWALTERLHGRSAVFRLTAPCELREWTEQPWVRRRSRGPQTRRKLRNAAALLARADFAALRRKWRHDRELRRNR